jgi:hypothetical protein
MPDPVITRDPPRIEEMYTQGKLSGFRLAITYRDGDKELTTVDTWPLPDDEWVWVEDWMENRRELMGSMMLRASAGTNIELEASKAVVEYVTGLSES